MWKSILDLITGRTARRARLEAEVTLWLDRSVFEVKRNGRVMSATRR